MWTYMMAASRGERANSMMSSRRRNESESPKYGYNPSRPMYRTTRFSAPSTSSQHPSTAATSTSTAYGGSSGGGGGASTFQHSSSNASTTSPQMFHTYAATQQQRLPPLHNNSGSRCCSIGNNDCIDIDIGEEDGTSLFSPLSPSATLTAVDKDTSIFHCRDNAVRCMVRKHLIANHVGATTENVAAATLVRIPMHDSDDDGGTTAMMGRRGRRHRHDRHSRIYQQEYDDDDDSDINDDCVGNGADGEYENDAMTRDAEADYLENEKRNGKRMSQDQSSKRSKPSALRRTLNALRQRLTSKRSRAKPPDWFLERFSNANNIEKIGITTATTTTANAIADTAAAGAAAADAVLASEIRGSSRLCNRLSVNPTLQSHYRWLAIVSLAVLYNIIFVVGRSVFWEINQRAVTLWYFMDYLCDLIYLVDTLVHMHEGYLDQGLLVRDAYKLRRHYFTTKGWYIDVFSMLPTDLAYIWWSPSSCSSTFLPCAVIVRLNRLVRLPRLWEWFDRTETATGYPNAFRICKVVLAILVLIHWNACMYFAISYALGFGTDNWVYNLKGYRNATLQRQYIYSFYWSTLTLTTIGETPTPENDAEYLFVVADFLAGVLIFATIVGNIGSMISNMNVARVEFQNRMDGVKQYMAFRKVGHELEARVIRWFAYTWSQSGALDEERVLAALPDKLKAEIAIQVHMDTLKQVRIFHDCEPGLLEALVLKLKLQVFSPGDYICRKGDVGKEMYIVKRGKLSVVADDGVTVFATLGAGSVFGEVSVLEIAGNRTGNRRTANVRSLGYSDLFCLAKRDLWETLGDYPEARATLTERGCQLLRKDGLLDEHMFSDSQRVHDSIESGIEKLEVSVENLNLRLARLLAEYTASQAKMKQRLAKLELNYQLTHTSVAGLSMDPQARPRSGRLYSLQPKKRPRRRQIASASKSIDNKQNTL